MVPRHAGARRLKPARAEWIRFSAADDASSHAAMMANLRPVPQRWSLCQIKDELSRRCRLAGIAVSEAAGPISQQSGAIRARWPQA